MDYHLYKIDECIKPYSVVQLHYPFGFIFKHTFQRFALHSLNLSWFLSSHRRNCIEYNWRSHCHGYIYIQQMITTSFISLINHTTCKTPLLNHILKERQLSLLQFNWFERTRYRGRKVQVKFKSLIGLVILEHLCMAKICIKRTQS